MKRSTTPTNHILIKAYTNSTYDNCDFVLARINEEWKSTMQKRLEAIEPFTNDSTFDHLAFWEVRPFYQSPNSCSLADKILLDSEVSAFVILEPGEINRLPVPKDELTDHQIIIHRNGFAHFTAWSESNADKYWTARFDIIGILNTIFTQVRATL